MKLYLQRAPSTEVCTLGSLTIDGAPECSTLELPIRDGLPGSAIPDGTFRIVLAPSPKFQHAARTDPWIAKYCDGMPHIIHIPKRSLIMLHWGNLVADTDGCILVGRRAETNAILHSRLAFEHFYPKIVPAVLSPTGCWIEIASTPLTVAPNAVTAAG